MQLLYQVYQYTWYTVPVYIYQSIPSIIHSIHLFINFLNYTVQYIFTTKQNNNNKNKNKNKNKNIRIKSWDQVQVQDQKRNMM